MKYNEKIIYYRSAKTASSSIIRDICNVTKKNKNLKLDQTMIQYVNKTFAVDFKNFNYALKP